MTPETGPSELREYLGVLWRRKWLIVIMIAATLGAALLYTSRQTRMYRSSAQVLVNPISTPVQAQSSFPQVNMASEQLIATSPEVGAVAEQQLADQGVDSASISVDASIDDQTLTFSSRSSEPRRARATAQAYAQAYLEHRRTQLQDDLQLGEDAINEVVDRLNQSISSAEQDLTDARASGDDARASVLELRISSLSSQVSTQQASLNELLLAGSQSVGQMLVPASLPTSPSSPDVRRNGILGLLLGIALGVGLAFLVERLDERLRRREDVEESTGAPLIARIPLATMPKRGVLILEDPYAEASEAYRGLRARVQYGATQLGAKAIMVTSFQGDEGKTTTALNLAAALAQTDKRTVLVSADLRRPSLREYFGGGTGPGLTDVLLGQADLIEALVPTEVENLFVVPSGTRVENPSELLGSEAMREVTSALSANADFVIVDAAPVAGASDALSMAPIVRWVLFVADARRSRRSSIAEAVIELRSVGASVLGVVLTHVSSRDHAPYAYSYRHREHENGQEPSKRAVASLLDRLGRRS